MPFDRSERVFIRHTYNKLLSIKEIVGPLNEDSDPNDGRLELVLGPEEIEQLHVRETYKGPQRYKMYEVAYPTPFRHSYTLLSLIHDIAEREMAHVESEKKEKSDGIDWEQLKEDTIDKLNKDCGIWENSPVINNFLKIIAEKYDTFVYKQGINIGSSYDLIGNVRISMPDKLPFDDENKSTPQNI